jgi:hypothetical protein
MGSAIAGVLIANVAAVITAAAPICFPYLINFPP